MAFGEPFLRESVLLENDERNENNMFKARIVRRESFFTLPQFVTTSEKEQATSRHDAAQETRVEAQLKPQACAQLLCTINHASIAHSFEKSSSSL